MAVTVEGGTTPAPGQCWCCGKTVGPAALVQLGYRPEVGVCSRCARSLAKRAWAVDDRSRTGIAVFARDQLRRIRAAVIQRGWHRNRFVGRILRGLGRFTP